MVPPVIKVNTTAGLFAALNTTTRNNTAPASSSHPTIILLARGNYIIPGTSIDLPPFTTLKGVSMAKVSLVWNMPGW